MTNFHSIIIAGGGLSGMIAALGLAHYKIPSLIIERNKLNNDLFNQDQRTTSLNLKAVELLKEYELWNHLSEFTCPIEQIHVKNNMTQEPLIFAHETNNDMADRNAMGYMIKNSDFKRTLFQFIQNNEFIKVNDQIHISDVVAGNDVTQLFLSNNSHQTSCNLLLCCEGRNSAIRKKFTNIATQKNYHQNAIIFNIQHPEKHNNIAVEFFAPEGPFAILPLKSGKQSSIVWTLPENVAKIYAKMDIPELKYHVALKTNDYFSDIEIISNVQTYPLSAYLSEQYYHNNIAFIADAAHAIHPLAGQGLNMGIGDIKVIVELIVENHKLGLNLGSEMLSKYHKQRHKDNKAMFLITDKLNFIFSNQYNILHYASAIGLKLVNSSPKLKKFFMNYAMGKRA